MKKIIRIVTVPESFSLFKGQMAFMKKSFEFKGVSSDGKEIDFVEESEGIVVKKIELSRRISPFKDLLSLFRMIVFLKHEKPFIVHTHTPKAGTIGMIASRIVGVKHRLHTVAGMPLMESRGIKRFVLDIVEKITYACSTNILPNSLKLKDFIIKNNYCNEGKVSVIANGSTNGIETSFFSSENFNNAELEALKERYKINNNFIFLSVGRIVKDKGIVELVSAFKQFNIVNPNSKLILVGNYEEERDPLPSEIMHEIKTNNSIVFCGHQKDVRPFFAIADLFVFPSYREGFPNVVMQAGAMEVPSIVSNINGSNEIIEDGVNGLIIPVKNADILLEKMNYLYKNRLALLDLKSNCRKMIVDRYEQSFVWNEVNKMYKRLI